MAGDPFPSFKKCPKKIKKRAGVFEKKGSPGPKIQFHCKTGGHLILRSNVYGKRVSRGGDRTKRDGKKERYATGTTLGVRGATA